MLLPPAKVQGERAGHLRSRDGARSGCAASGAIMKASRRFLRYATRCRELAFLVVLVALFGSSSTGMSAELRLELAPGPPELVFDPGRNGCSPADIPDAAARAFRDADGAIHLVATHFEDRQLIGPTFDALKHPCEQIFVSREDPDPAAYADRSWLTAFFTKDGRTVHALIHHEYQGNTHPSALCPSRQYGPCWENSILTTVSTDGGYHFAAPVIPRDLVAAAPVRYIGEAAKKPIGYFQPSNIVAHDGYYYVLIKATAFGDQPGGPCLFRTSDLSEPRSWKAWDGHDFTVSFPDPYREAVPDTRPRCALVRAKEGLGDTVMSLVRDEVTGLFVAITSTMGRAGTRFAREGTYYAVSRDLISWSELTLLMPDPLPWTHTCEREATSSYPSLIDHAAGDRNFTSISASPKLYLYYTQSEFSGCGGSRSRKLMRRGIVRKD